MKQIILLGAASVMCLGLSGCETTLGDAFSDVQSAAPGVCKAMCQEETECRWNDADFDADQGLEEGLQGNTVDQCVIDCSYPMSEGDYVIEFDENDDEILINDWVGGGLVQKVRECIYRLDFYVCDENENTGRHDYKMDINNDEECAMLDDCVQGLDVDFDCGWDPSMGVGGDCACTGVEEVMSVTCALPRPNNDTSFHNLCVW